MELTRANIQKVVVAPDWLQEYMLKLVKATGYDGVVWLVVADASNWPQRVGITDNPEGYAIITESGADMIVLPDNASEEDALRWHGVILHEFVHILHARVDRFVHPLLNEQQRVEYVTLCEKFVEPFAALLMFGAHMNVEYIRDEEESAGCRWQSG